MKLKKPKSKKVCHKTEPKFEDHKHYLEATQFENKIIKLKKPW